MSAKITAMSKLRLLAKTIVFRSASSLGLTKALIRRESGKGILILCYHGVVPDSHPGEFLYRNTVSIREFSNHLEFLSRRFHFMPRTARNRRLTPHGSPAIKISDSAAAGWRRGRAGCC